MAIPPKTPCRCINQRCKHWASECKFAELQRNTLVSFAEWINKGDNYSWLKYAPKPINPVGSGCPRYKLPTHFEPDWDNLNTKTNESILS